MDDNVIPFPDQVPVYDFNFLLNACTTKSQCALIALITAQAVFGSKVIYDSGDIVQQITARDFINALHGFVTELEQKAKTLPPE